MFSVSRRDLVKLFGIIPVLNIGSLQVETKDEDLISTISNLNKERISINERYAEALKQFSRSQKEYWQKIPYLLLQIDGRSGYSGISAHAYTNGLLSIRDILYIDLESGELVNRYTPYLPADTNNILQLSLKDLDAKAMIADYHKILSEQEKEWPAAYSIKQRVEWRKDLAERCGLNPNTYKKPYFRS